MQCLISDRFPDQNDMDAVRYAASARDDRLTAHAVGREAVVAEAGQSAWCLSVQADAVCRSGDAAEPAQGIVYSGHQFVHAGDDHDLIRSVDHRCDAVAVAVDVDQLTVRCDGVGTHEIDVTAERVAVHLLDLFRAVCLAAVDQTDVIPAS